MTVRFGSFRFDRSRRTLWRDGTPVPLTAPTFTCLDYLLTHRDRAVSRDELIRAIWKRENVSDAQLGRVIVRARRAVGDEGDAQGVIRTVVGFGYCWAMPVEADIEADTTPAADRPADAEPPERPHAGIAAPAAARVPRRVVALLLLAGALAVLAVTLSRPPDAGVSRPASAAHRLAVLPLRVAAGTDAQWARLGGMDLIVERLRGTGLAVVPSETLLTALSDTASDPHPETVSQHLRRATGATVVVAAALRRRAADWVVDTEVTAEDLHVVGEDRAADPVRALEAASERIGAALGVHAFGSAGDSALVEFIQRARAALLDDQPEQALAILEQAPTALRETPDLRFHRAQVESRSGRLDEAMEQLSGLLAELSPQDDPRLTMLVRIARGGVHFRLSRYQEALDDFDAALRVPSAERHPYALGEAWNGRGVALINLPAHGPAEAAAALGRARTLMEAGGHAMGVVRIDFNLGLLDFKQGAYASAQRRIEQALERYAALGARREVLSALYMLQDIHLLQLRHADALAASDRAWALVEDRRGDPMLWRALALQRARVLVAVGRLEAAGQLLDAVEHEGLAHAGAVDDDIRADLLRVEIALRRGDRAQAIRSALRLPAAPRPERGEDALFAQALRYRLQLLPEAYEMQTRYRQVPPADAGLGTVPALHWTLGVADRDWDAGRLQHADAAFRQALALAAGTGAPALLATAAERYAARLIEAGRVEDAAAAAAQVAAWATQDFDCALMQARVAHALGQAGPWHESLMHARRLAGERAIPADLALAPTAAAAARHL